MLPYGLKMHDADNFTVELSKFGPMPGETPISLFGRIIDDGWLPCLRPLDDMTEDEKEELTNFIYFGYPSDDYDRYGHRGIEVANVRYDDWKNIEFDFEEFCQLEDWLDEHLFDYRTVEDEDGNQVTMIQAGLAVAATKDMYNIKGI